MPPPLESLVADACVSLARAAEEGEVARRYTPPLEPTVAPPTSSLEVKARAQRCCLLIAAAAENENCYCFARSRGDEDFKI